jgi:hypothetical protein
MLHNRRPKITYILQPQATLLFVTMENLFILIATSFVLRLSTSRKFKNLFIGETGCSALMFSSHFKKSLTPSGDVFYFNEFSEKEVTYGIICIELKQEYELRLTSEMLASYINKLRAPYFILHNTGLTQATDWNHVSSIAMVDYWQDGEKQDWKVKGYANGNTLAILYVKNIGHVEVKKQDLFLDGFHFKA